MDRLEPSEAPLKNKTFSASVRLENAEKRVWHHACSENGMMTTMLIVAALLAAGFFVEVIAATSAPVGYQDETGFHYGPEEALTTPDEAVLAHGAALHNPA